MLFPIVPVIGILGLSLIAAKLFRINIENSFSIVVSSITLALYIFSYNHSLEIGSQLTLVLGIIAFIAYIPLLAYELKRKNKITEIDFSSFVIFILFCILLWCIWLVSKNQELFIWDDFSHWGYATKEIFYTSKLPSTESQLIFKDYPPGGSLFNYFLLRGNYFLQPEENLNFNEGVALFAQSIPLITNFILLSGYCLRRINYKVATQVFILQICLYFALGYIPNNLMIDGWVACAFCSAILTYLICGRSIKGILLALPSLLLLVILKNVGIYLAWLSISIMIIDQICLNHKQYFSKNLNSEKLIAFSVLVSCILSIINLQLSWKNYYLTVKEEATFKINIELSTIINSLFSSTNEIEKLIKSNFLQKFIPIQISYPFAETSLTINNASFIAIAFILYLIFKMLKPKFNNSRGDFSISVMLLLGFLVYVLGLLILYLFSFSQYEAIRMASFDRYLGIYLYGTIPILLYLNLYQKEFQKTSLNRILSIILILLIIVSANNIRKYVQVEKNVGTQNFIEKMNQLISDSKILISSNTRIYFISQCDTGLGVLMFKYLVYPSQVSQNYYSVGTKCNSDDIWTGDISPENLKLKIVNYDYLVIARINSSLNKEYSSVFKIKLEENSVYKINKIHTELILQKIN